MSENQDSNAASLSSSYHSKEDSEVRLATFDHYPPPHNVNVLHLSKHGFMYADAQVFCVGCGKQVDSWSVGDVPSDQKFHNSGCRFVAQQHGHQRKNENSHVRATSEQGNEEDTKPFEALPGPSASNIVSAFHQPAQAQSLRVKVKEVHPKTPQSQPHSFPGTHTVELTRVHKRDEGHQSTFSLSRFRQLTANTPYQSGHTSISSQAPSEVSLPLQQYQSGSYHQRNPNQPYESLNQSTISFAQQVQRNLQRLENPDPIQDVLNQLDLRNAQHRLYTFEQYWAREIVFRNVKLLVKYGFYCIGQDDAVECFCCHVICANWSRNDNPRERHREMSPHCRFIKGEECGDIPLAIERRTRSYSPFQPLPPIHQPSPPFSSQVSSNPSPTPSLSSIQPSTSHGPQSHTPEIQVAPPQNQPHPSNVQPSENVPSQESRGPNPVTHPSVTGASRSLLDYQNPSQNFIERSNWMLEFPCVNPANPSMREERNRLQSFNNPTFRRNTNLQATNETLAQAGLYYLGDGDRTKCWFCDGGLKDFEVNDDPWVEHAKYYPECEFMLQQRGPGWVTSVSLRHPHVQRPILPARSGRVLPQVVSSPHPLPPPPDRIEDPQQLLHNRERMVEQAMNSEPVATARAMGFTDERIREVQMRKVMRNNNVYQTNESLIDALLAPNEEAEAAADAEHQGGLPMDEGNVIDMSNGTIHIRGGNFIGPSVINGRIYNPQGQNPQGDEMFTYENSRRPRDSRIIINGRPMEQFMSEVFESAFSNNPPYTHRGPIHRFNNRGMTISTRTVQRAPAPPQIHVPRITGSNIHTLSSPSTPAPPQIHVPRITGSNIHTLSSPSTPAPTPMPRPQVQPTPPPVVSGTPEERLEQMQRERRCKICLTEESDILFQPCGHICACTGCSQRLNVCPVCRRRIVRYIRTYHA